METTIKSKEVHASQKTVQTIKTNPGIWEKAEDSRFGIIPILLVVIGCIGGLAAAFGAYGEPLKLSLVAFPTIIALALTLAVAPMRLIIYVSVIAVILDLVVLFI